MNTRLSACAAIAAAALALAGCGTSGSGSPQAGGSSAAATSTTSSITPAAWVEKLCTSLSVDVKALDAEPDTSGLSDPAAAKTFLVDMFTALGDTITNAAEHLTELGPPPVSDGAALHKKSLATLGEFQDTVRTAAADVAKLDPADEEAFVAAIDPIMTELEGLDSVDPISRFDGDAELKAALQSTPSCKDVYTA